MTLRTSTNFAAMVIAVCTLVVGPALAETTVNGASPNFADQGTFDLDVEITGTGFDSGTEVAFYISGTNDTGGVNVKKTKVRGSKKIIATIDVPLNANIADYDIEAFSARNGRGRGTTIFFVFEQNSGKTCAPWPECNETPSNDPISTCNEVYFPGDPDLPCTDLSGGECEFVEITNTPGWLLNEHCKTTKTIVIPPDIPFFDGQHNSMRFVAGASGVWEGARSGIMNGSRGVRFHNLVLIADGAAVADGSCLGDLDDDPSVQYGKLASAAQINPYRDTGSHVGPRPNIGSITVRTENGAQFCNAIEYGGATVDSLLSDDTGFKAGSGLAFNIVEADTYSQHGLVMQFIDFRDDVEEALILDNTVAESAGACAGIRVNFVERVNIERNTVTAPAGCAGNPGVAIDVSLTGVAYDDGLGNVLEDEQPSVFDDNTMVTTGDGDIAVRFVGSAVGSNDSNIIACDAPADTTYEIVNPEGSVSFPTKRRNKNTANGETLNGPGACPVP